MPERSSSPNCYHCLHYKSSGRTDLPHVCTLFGLHSHRLPSFEIRSALRQNCPHFEPKPLPPDPEEPVPDGPGWIA